MDETSRRLASDEVALTVLKQLQEIGAINLDVLVNAGDKVGSVLADVGIDDWDRGICYKHYIRVFFPGPLDGPITSLTDVAGAMRELNIEIRG